VPDDEVLVQVWSPAGALLYRSSPSLAAPFSAAPGYATLDGGGQAWRSYSRSTAGGVVQAAQSLAERRELALGLSLRLLAPLLLALPLLGLSTWWLVRRALRPVRRLGEALVARTDDALDPVPGAGLPQELQPLVGGFNRLLQRLGQAFAAQRALVADAAHELRTPLAVVQLQAQGLERSAGADEHAAALQALRGGVERAARMVQQLLTLARQEPGIGGAAPAKSLLQLDALAREVLAELVPLAQDRNIELGLQADAPVSLRGDAAGLRALLGNLVENALHYTPEGGRVEVTVAAGPAQAYLSVRDTGPGIAPAQRALVLQRFYRAPGAPGSGSGLGLAIAAAVVQRHGGRLELGEAPGGGLEVKVELPAGDGG
jgi:two-component system OmpR family sensor kinase